MIKDCHGNKYKILGQNDTYILLESLTDNSRLKLSYNMLTEMGF